MVEFAFIPLLVSMLDSRISREQEQVLRGKITFVSPATDIARMPKIAVRGAFSTILILSCAYRTA
jgi:hypothetical protein